MNQPILSYALRYEPTPGAELVTLREFDSCDEAIAALRYWEAQSPSRTWKLFQRETFETMLVTHISIAIALR